MDVSTRRMRILLVLAVCALAGSLFVLIQSHRQVALPAQPPKVKALPSAEDHQREAVELAKAIATYARSLAAGTGDWRKSDEMELLMDKLSLLGPDALPGVDYLLGQGMPVAVKGVTLLDALETGVAWSEFYYGDGEPAARAVPGAAELVARYATSDIRLVKKAMIQRAHLYFDDPWPLILPATHDASVWTRSYAFRLVGELYVSDKAAVRRVIEGLRDPEPLVRASAAGAAGKGYVQDAVEPLKKLLDDTNEIDPGNALLEGEFRFIYGGEEDTATVRHVAVWAIQKIRRKFYGFVSLAETTEDIDVIVARIRADDFVPPPPFPFP